MILCQKVKYNKWKLDKRELERGLNKNKDKKEKNF